VRVSWTNAHDEAPLAHSPKPWHHGAVAARYEVIRTDDPLETHLLLDHEAKARVVVAPPRGGMVTRFVVGHSNVLYLDAATLRDQTKNVRGGIPVLFPIAGRLPDDKYVVDGTTFTMKQHGFARNMPWAIVDQATDGGARVGLSLSPTSVTRAQYPFEFRLEMTYLLADGQLTVRTRVSNLGERPMPVSPGLHPYFQLGDAEKAGARVLTDGTQAWDNRAGRVVPLATPIDLTADVVDLHVLDHWPRTVRLMRPGDRDLELALGVPDRVLVIWTERGKDFVCVEPWMARGGALSDGSAPTVPPGGTLETSFSIAAV
jgi:galactose mutarotase-like enzyme